MSLNVGKVVSELRTMTVTELRRKYAEVFGEETRSHHKDYLLRRIAWRMQANAEGDLPERARQRAMEIAKDADIRLRAPAGAAQTLTSFQLAEARRDGVTLDVPIAVDDRLPMPGALLTRTYKGQTIRVRVLPNGFDYEGVVYRSLSAIAQVVTGSHWNGYLFFGLKPPKRLKRETQPVGVQ